MDVVLVEVLAVEGSALDIDILLRVVLCYYGELLSGFCSDGGFLENRASDYVFVSSRGYALDSEGAEHIPG